jgi:hypothetical protein
MLKGLAILAVICFAVEAMPAQNQVGGKGPTSQRQQDARQPAPPSVASITNNQATSDYQQDGKDKPQRWHKFVTWPEGIATWAVVLTLIAISLQTWQTRRAAEAARDSIRLQETAYQQWVALRNWSIDFQEALHQFRIRVEIVNQTSYPLTLNQASLTFGDAPNTMTASLSEDFFLAPEIPYIVDVGLHVYDDQLRGFNNGYFGLMVQGKITHTGVLRRPATQDIGGILVAGKGKQARFDTFVPMHPKSAQATKNA